MADQITNETALLAMISASLPEIVQREDAFMPLGVLFCDYDSCPQKDETNADTDVCLGCFRTWLQATYAGAFTMEDGRVRIREEASENG